jgi:acylphosphatase
LRCSTSLLSTPCSTAERKVGTAVRRVRLVVSGRVQGVGFRYAALREARRLGLVGWARNTPDGQVEIVAEGPDDAVQAFVTWCHQGPPSARVTAVRERHDADTEPLTTFAIR